MRYIFIPALVITVILGQIEKVKNDAKHEQDLRRQREERMLIKAEVSEKRFNDEMEFMQYKIDYHKMTGHWKNYGISDYDKKRVDSWRLGLDKS